MAEIVKYAYVMIIVLFLFLVATNVDGKPYFILFKFSYLVFT